MRFFFILFFILTPYKIICASSLFDTNFNYVEFESNNIQEKKILEINKIKFDSILFILKKILKTKDYDTINNYLSENLINTFIKNIIIEDEKIINNKYFSKIKINFDKKKIINFLREKTIPYIEYYPDKFLLIIYEDYGLNKNLLSINNKHYAYFLENLYSNDFFQIPNLDINDRFILKTEDVKNKNYNKIINFSKKYNNNEIIIIQSFINNNVINYNFIMYSNGEIVEKKLDLNENNYRKFFNLLEYEALDTWKKINQIQNNTLNIMNCNINYFNISELKEVRSNLNKVSVIDKLEIKSISFKNIEYDIYYYGNDKIFINILQQNKLKISNIENFCNIKLK